MKIALVFHATFMVAWLLIANPLAAQGFRISGTQILDPTGRPFVPLGVNMNGSHASWNEKTLPLAKMVAEVWKFNTIRLNCRLPGVRPKKPLYYSDNDDEEAIVKAYTSKKVVVIFEPHNWTCSYPTVEEMPLLIAWHVERANRYKNNPYVWFNIANEPGGSGEASPQWLEMHHAVIKAIRAAGANNIVVCDGAACGQDTGVWDNKPVKENNSAILSYGPKLARDAGGAFENVLFSLHTYDQWRFGDEKLRSYIERVQKKKLALFIGETGAPASEEANRRLSTESTYRVALPMGVGILAWHAQPGDGFSLCTGKPGGIKSTDDDNNPTNLTWHGKLLWDATHARPRR